MPNRQVQDFVAAVASEKFRYMGRDLGDILEAVVEAAGVAVADLDKASVDRALASVVPRMKKVRLEDGPRAIAAFVEWAGGACGVKGAAELAKGVVQRGVELAREDEKKRVPVVNKGAEVNRNDPCPCGSGKKYKKCCGG